MFKRKMLTATLVAVGLFVSLEYKSIAQSNQPTAQPSPGTTQQNGTTTQPSPGTTQQNGTTTQPSTGTTQQNGTRLSASDRQFITQAAQGGMAEVQLGQLALKRASSNQVKKYAQQMINDHTRANKQLMALATKRGVTPPTTIGSRYEAVRARLSKLSGRNFDQAYMNEAGIKAHAEQETLYRSQSQQGQDPQLKAFAAKTLPVVQGHLRMAQKITGTTSTGTTSPSPTSSPSPSPTSSPSPSPTFSPSPSPTFSPSPSPTFSPSPSPTSSP